MRDCSVCNQAGLFGIHNLATAVKQDAEMGPMGEYE